MPAPFDLHSRERCELLPWHRQAWARLQIAFEGARWPHGLLLSGPDGIGKRQFATAVAQRILCRAPMSETGLACGRCAGCRWFLAATHPDHFLLGPEEKGKPIRIDQVRLLCRGLALTSQLGGHKVAVVITADSMNLAAANALLKTLEEPTANTLLLLVSSRPAMLPATVRSRCHRVHLHPAPAGQAVGWLQRRVPSAVDPHLLLRLSGGAPLKALAMAESDAMGRRAAMFAEYLEVCRGRADPVAVAERWHGLEFRECLAHLLSWTADAIRLKAAASPPTLINEDLQAELRSVASAREQRLLFAMWRIFQDALANLDRPVHTQLWFERVFIAWSAGAPR